MCALSYLADRAMVPTGVAAHKVDPKGDMLGLGKADWLALRDLAAGEFYAFGPARQRRVQAEADELATTRQQMADLRRALSARPV